MNAIPSARISQAPAIQRMMQLNIWNRIKRIGPLGAIILLHVVFFYALESGLLRKAADALPKEVFVSFITPDAPKPTPPVDKPKPKTVPIVQKTVTPPLPALAPSPTAVSVPAPPPQPAAPEPSPAPATPRTITTGVEYIQRPQPEYPAASKRMGEQGQVQLRVLVNEKGRAESVDIKKSSGSPRLDEAARQAVRRALFKPYTEDGKVVPVFAIVPIDFQLNN